MAKLSDKRLDYLESLINNDKVRALLDVISATEGADYDSLVYDGKIKSFDDHPNQLKTAKIRLNNGKIEETASTAAGRYQINNSTWTGKKSNGDQAEGVLQWSNGRVKDFSPKSQDLAALILLDKAGALDAWMNDDYKNALDKASSTWAGLPKDKYSVSSYGYGDVGEFLKQYPSIKQDKLAEFKGFGANGKANPLSTKITASTKPTDTTGEGLNNHTYGSTEFKTKKGKNVKITVADFAAAMDNIVKTGLPYQQESNKVYPQTSGDQASTQAVNNGKAESLTPQLDYEAFPQGGSPTLQKSPEGFPDVNYDPTKTVLGAPPSLADLVASIPKELSRDPIAGESLLGSPPSLEDLIAMGQSKTPVPGQADQILAMLARGGKAPTYGDSGNAPMQREQYAPATNSNQPPSLQELFASVLPNGGASDPIGDADQPYQDTYNQMWQGGQAGRAVLEDENSDTPYRKTSPKSDEPNKALDLAIKFLQNSDDAEREKQLSKVFKSEPRGFLPPDVREYIAKKVRNIVQ